MRASILPLTPGRGRPGPEGEASGGDAAAGAAREAPQGETVRKRPTLTVVK